MGEMTLKDLARALGTLLYSDAEPTIGAVEQLAACYARGVWRRSGTSEP